MHHILSDLLFNFSPRQIIGPAKLIKGNVSRSFIFSKASITGSLFNHLLNLFRFREHIRHESSIPFSSIRRGIQFAESVSNIFSEKSEYVELFNEERNMLSRTQLIQ